MANSTQRMLTLLERLTTQQPDAASMSSELRRRAANTGPAAAASYKTWRLSLGLYSVQVAPMRLQVIAGIYKLQLLMPCLKLCWTAQG